jgi:hypothetical protein
MRYLAICPTCENELRQKSLIDAVQASGRAHDLRAEIVGSARRLEAILRVDGAPPSANEELARLNALVDQLHAAELDIAHMAEARAEQREARQRKRAAKRAR